MRRSARLAKLPAPAMSAGSHRRAPSEVVMKNQCWTGLKAIFAMLVHPISRRREDPDPLDPGLAHDEPRAERGSEQVRRPAGGEKRQDRSTTNAAQPPIRPR
jgi:hypothetical protein